MELKAVARVFDTCSVYDAYSGALLFKAQTSTFLESSSEGSTSARRVISLDPSLTPPSHSAVLILGQLTLIGYGNPDEWAGATIRQAYWTKRVTDDFRLLTPGQAALSSAGTAAYGQKAYLKSTVNGTTNAQYDVQWLIALSASLTLVKGTFLRSGTTLYRVRSSYLDIDGFRSAECDEIDLPATTATFVNGSAYDPITDAYTATSIVVPALLIDLYKVYDFKTIADARNLSGDMALVLAKSSATPVVGTGLTIGTQSWRVLNVNDEQDSWALHIRRT